MSVEDKVVNNTEVGEGWPKASGSSVILSSWHFENTENSIVHFKPCYSPASSSAGSGLTQQVLLFDIGEKQGLEGGWRR